MSSPKRIAEAVFFKAIELGDVRKHRAESNDADSGGGARDLRIPIKFQSRIVRFFPDAAVGERDGVKQGLVRWLDAADKERQAIIKLWPPTASRPGEVRVGQIYLIDGWSVDEAEFKAAAQAGQTWFYLLSRTSAGEVWAQVSKQDEWKSFRLATVREFMAARIAKPEKNGSIYGFINLSKNDFFPAITDV